MFMPGAISPSPVRAASPLSPANRRRLSCRHFVLGAQQMHSIAFTVNGKPASIAADPDTPLLDVLRNHLGLTGTKFGCGLEQCGTCKVVMEGKTEQYRVETEMERNAYYTHYEVCNTTDELLPTSVTVC